MLAFACAFTMFAGAAFTDQADINDVNAEAVNTLVALGVIDGYEDGSFRPDDTVTRAEMAKMIYTIRTGRSDASAYNDDATSFTDITSHWARGYIKYCQSMGIIAGKSVTSFDPDNTVTTQEAAKMLLVTLGYDAEKAGLEGASWGQKTNALADENGLLKDVNNGTTQGLPRVYAAQLIYNAVNAATVEYRDGAYYNKNLIGRENDTIGEKYMGLENPKGILTSVKYDDNDDVYTTVVGDKTFDAAADYSDLMGQEVRALYKEGKNGADDELYGLFATDKNNTVTTLYDDAKISGTTATIDDEDYDITGITTIATNGATIKAADYDDWDNYPYAEVTLVDNDNDKVYEYAVVNPFKVAQLTSLTAKKAYFENALDDTDTYSMDIDKLDAYEDMAEDDYVLLTEDTYSVSGNYVAVKAETVSGKVSGTRTDGSILIDGNWYSNAGVTDVPSSGDELDYAVVVNGFYFATEGATGSADKLALVLKVGNQDFDGDYRDVKLLLSDGNTKTTKAYVKDGSDKNAPEVATLYTYNENSDGYVLKAIADGEDIGMDKDVISGEGGTIKYNSTTNKVDDKRLAADAQVFVLYDKSGNGATASYSGKLITGSEADKWADGQYWFTVAYTDGNVKVMVASVGTGDLPNATDDNAYGVILSDPYSGTDEDENDIWIVESFLTESGVTSITVDADEWGNGLVKNTLVSYKMDGSDYVEVEKGPADATYAVGAVTDVDGDYVTIKTASGSVELKVDEDDSTVLYFDSESGDEATGSIKKATKQDDTNYYANIMVIYKTAEETDESHIIWGAAVDVNNELLNDNGDNILIAIN